MTEMMGGKREKEKENQKQSTTDRQRIMTSATNANGIVMRTTVMAVDNSNVLTYGSMFTLTAHTYEN